MIPIDPLAMDDNQEQRIESLTGRLHEAANRIALGHLLGFFHVILWQGATLTWPANQPMPLDARFAPDEYVVGAVLRSTFMQN